MALGKAQQRPTLSLNSIKLHQISHTHRLHFTNYIIFIKIHRFFAGKNVNDKKNKKNNSLSRNVKDSEKTCWVYGMYVCYEPYNIPTLSFMEIRPVVVA